MPKVTIIGSYRKHFERIIRAKQSFEELGAEVLRPREETIASVDAEIVRLKGDPGDAGLVRQAQLDAIRDSDLVYVVNPGGYVGSSGMFELGYSTAHGIAVYCSEPPFEAAISDEAKLIGTPAQAIERYQEAA